MEHESMSYSCLFSNFLKIVEEFKKNQELDKSQTEFPEPLDFSQRKIKSSTLTRENHFPDMTNPTFYSQNSGKVKHLEDVSQSKSKNIPEMKFSKILNSTEGIKEEASKNE